MVDVELLVRDELERLAPGGGAPPDWSEVRRRARPARSRHAIALVVAAVVVGVAAAPTLALSASVRDFFGLGRRPVLTRAVPVLSAPAGHGLLVRLWASPALPFGRCEFVTVIRAGRPLRIDRAGAGLCGTAGNRLRALRQPLTFNLALNRGGRVPAILDGFVAPRLRAARVELRWATGSQSLRFRRGWFLGVPRSLPNPARSELPYRIVAYDARGRVVARKRIPIGFLYLRKRN